MFPHWIPSTEAELLRACEERSLHEGHYWDAKRQIDKTDRARKGLAKDIAAFAVDGGLIVIGLDEVREDEFALTPVTLTGYPTRIAEIAEAYIQPPVASVRCTVLPSEDNPETGYIFVLVEPSLDAPHQVEGIYYKRGDRKNEVMGDAEVARLISLRRSYGTRTAALLDIEVAREPVRSAFSPEFPAAAPFGHIYWVAEPVAARANQAVALHNGGQMERLMSLLVNDHQVPGLTVEDCNLPPTGYLPVLPERRANGWGLTTNLMQKGGRRYLMTGLDTNYSVDNALADIDFLRSGGMRAVFGRALYAPDMNRDPSIVCVDVGYLLRLTHRLVGMAARYGEATGYTHGWDFGVHISSLRGHRSDDGHGYLWRGGTPWSEDDYRETTTATTRQIVEEPWVTVNALMERLVNGLDCFPVYHRLLQPPEQKSEPQTFR